MDDWDDTPSNGHATGSFNDGLDFNYGRGFNPRSDSGKPGYKSDDWGENSYQNGDGDGGDGQGRRGGRGRGGRGRGGRGGGRGGGSFNNNNHINSEQNGKDGAGDGPPPKPYIPPEPTTNEEEIFTTGITTGINFAKYDTIEIKTTGENIPPPISSFEEAGLRPLIIDNIKKSNYAKPTPIQRNSIPIVMSGRDLMACAQTGSGKTAAFLLPIIHRLIADPVDVIDGDCAQPQAVIVSPTRELAIQIYNEARKFAYNSILKIVIAYGGTSVGYQRSRLERGCHILVCTPGRMNDFAEKGRMSFDSVRFVVLDEADRMLDMGFMPDMERMLTHSTMTPTGERQTLMFSATFPEEIQRLAGRFLNNYVFLAVGIVGGACTDVEQRFFQVNKFAKRKKLLEILKEEGTDRTLVFVETKRNADFIASYLCENDLPTTSIHGDRLQREREEALSDFKSGRRHILVATGVAARGLDIKNVKHVINYDLPKQIEEYVHRIGRTGRVGNRGRATSFFDDSQDGSISGALRNILRQAGQPVPDWLSASGGSLYENSSFGGTDFRNEEDFGSGQDSRQEFNAEPEEDW